MGVGVTVGVGIGVAVGVGVGGTGVAVGVFVGSGVGVGSGSSPHATRRRAVKIRAVTRDAAFMPSETFALFKRHGALSGSLSSVHEL